MFRLSFTLRPLPLPSEFSLPPVSLPRTLLDPQLRIRPSSCLVSIVVWVLVGSSVLPAPQGDEEGGKKTTTSGNITSFSSRSSLKTCSMSFPQIQLLCVCFFFLFLFCVTLVFFFIFESFVSRPCTTVCSILTRYKPHTQTTRGSPVYLPYAIICPGFNSYQWVAVFFSL